MSSLYLWAALLAPIASNQHATHIQELHESSIHELVRGVGVMDVCTCVHVARAAHALQVRDRIAGRVPLPWEEPEAKASGHRQLRILKHTVLACLNRDPSARPTAAKLLRSWNRIFDTFSAGSGGVGTTTNVLAGRQPPQA